jgi:hypothetical protein
VRAGIGHPRSGSPRPEAAPASRLPPSLSRLVEDCVLDAGGQSSLSSLEYASGDRPGRRRGLPRAVAWDRSSGTDHASRRHGRATSPTPSSASTIETLSRSERHRSVALRGSRSRRASRRAPPDRALRRDFRDRARPAGRGRGRCTGRLRRREGQARPPTPRPFGCESPIGPPRGRAPAALPDPR